jgi:hypothetical protein
LLIFESLTLIQDRVNSSIRLSMDSSLELRSSKHTWDENFGRGAHYTRKNVLHFQLGNRSCGPELRLYVVAIHGILDNFSRRTNEVEVFPSCIWPPSQ